MPLIRSPATKVVVFQCPIRDADAQPLPARAAPMRAGHLRRGPGFVDEDKALWFKVELALEPVFAPLQHVGPILLARVRGLFLRVSLWRLQKRQSAATLALRARLRQPRLQLRQSDVGHLDKKSPDEIAMLLGAPRQPIAARVAAQTAQRLPADRAQGADPKPRRSLTARQAFINGGQDTSAKVERKRLGHEGRPPSPALILNQIKADSGIPELIQPARIPLKLGLAYDR